MQTIGGMRINKLPIAIIFAENGMIAFRPLQEFGTIVEYLGDGVQCILDSEGVHIGADTSIEYNTLVPYKETPELLAWLQAQQMQMPKFKKETE